MNASVLPDHSERPFLTDALLPDETGFRLLLLAEKEGWSLPQVVSAAAFDSRVGPLNEAFRREVGGEVITLRRVRGDQRTSVYALESHGPIRMPSGGRWVGRKELAALRLVVPEHRALLEEWFAESEHGEVPALRNAWARPGWFVEASAWIRRQLADRGFTERGPIEQFRSGSISCLLRVETGAGALYFKAVPPMFAREPALTQALFALYPAHVPRVLAIDPERGWMLMRELAGQPLKTVTEIGPWEDAVRLLARIQWECRDRTGWLFSLGCADRRLEVLAAQIDPLLADGRALAPACSGLSEAEIDRLQALAPRLKALCAEVAAGPVPPSLAHGDLHRSNIMAAGRDVRLFDWTDGCVTHPFLDLITLLPSEGLPDHPDAHDHLRDLYLEPWTDLAPMERLVPLFERAQVLGALHQAVSYQGIVAQVEDPSEMASGAPAFLRRVLTEMERLGIGENLA